MNKIYLVDDDEDDRLFARQALESVIEGIEIIELSDGEQLLIVLGQNITEEPALVLMDINMPRMNGLEALSAIRSNSVRKHIPVVMFSTSASRNAVEAAYQLGVNAYIVKPVTHEDYIRMAHALSLCFFNRYNQTSLPIRPQTISTKNVVIIEDNPDHYALMELSLMLGAPQLNLIHKSTAASAMAFFSSLDKKAATAVDLIILDLYLPTRKQGLDLLAGIRAMSVENGLSAVPIVVLSASSDPQDIKASYQHQANAYMVKTPQPARPFSYLADLCYFWQKTITLPSRVD